MAFKRSGRPIYAPSRLSEVSPALPLKQFHCRSDWRRRPLSSFQRKSSSSSSFYASLLQVIDGVHPSASKSDHYTYSQDFSRMSKQKFFISSARWTKHVLLNQYLINIKIVDININKHQLSTSSKGDRQRSTGATRVRRDTTTQTSIAFGNFRLVMRVNSTSRGRVAIVWERFVPTVMAPLGEERAVLPFIGRLTIIIIIIIMIMKYLLSANL